ncbi:ABC transporter permease [Paenibacillus sp. 1011MAR3C5]|uniref:ABC transporter permease n=1 Tax=Paenibacillus sp. 1011MAR3C5 TaxID=1675787 RepID=UPI000E6CE5E7|nr:FtsX-like permease family protein [Paenibacillus sp. 1011MAR3C5]RJE88553.1 ABC transporter permease [Paenibacillus sp. 1011MAR3C5]
MIDSSIVWRMALGNLRKHWKETLLTVFAGSIGAILIAISFVNYTSVQQSGKNWIETRLGPIDWRIIPNNPDIGDFTPPELEALRKHVDQDRSFFMLPYVAAEAALVAQETDRDGEGRALKSVMLMGFQHEDAARAEPKRAALWKSGLGDDELILSERMAKLLSVDKGDAVKLVSGEQSLLMRVRDIVDEHGLTGYRDSGRFIGNAIVSENTVRMLKGDSEDARYSAILMGNHDPSWPKGGMFNLNEVKFQTQPIKVDFQNKIAKMNTSIIIGLISAVAIVSSMLFMRQSLVMVADSRREMYGMFRAIGMPKRSVGAMFLLEALIIALLSTSAGVILGMGAGYGLVRLFYQSFSDQLSRMTGETIPIEPHLTIGGAAIVFGGIFLLLTVVALMAEAKASRFSVVEALRGETPGERSGGRALRFGAKVLVGIGIFMTISHLFMAFVDPPSMEEGTNVLWVGLFWIASCCTVLFLAIRLLRLLEKPMMKLLSLTGIPRISVMLAFKYPRVNGGRTYTIGLLFALVMMIVSFTVMIMSMIMSFNDVNRVDQTLYGYGGYAAYQHEEERTALMNMASEDKQISEKLTGMTFVEPFMISFVKNGLAQAVVPVAEDVLQGPELPLLERSGMFKSDREAWEAVAADPSFIILPDSYLGNTTIFPDAGPVKAGDTFTFPIYEDKLRGLDEEWLPVYEKTFTIAGIFHDVAGSVHVNDLYGITFMNPTVVEELRPFGFKWPNQTEKGYVLFRFEHKNIPLAQELEERFALNGHMGFTVPYVNNSAEQLMNKQLSFAFIGFTVFSGLIGLMGLSIIQYRAVKERSKGIAMMRCVGVAGRQIYWMFLIEGFVIGAVGLLTGWGIGATGSRLFIESALQGQPSFERAAIDYPSELILLILAGLLVVSLLLNIAPARAALKLKAADALRMKDE